MAARRFESYRIRHFMFNWLKQLFSKKQNPDEDVTVHFVLPTGKKFDVVALKPQLNKDACSIHPNYTGILPPTINCNLCWEFHSKIHRWPK